MRKLNINIDHLESIRELYPECFFTPQYPYNLNLNGKNFGEIEIIIKEELNLAEIKGDKKALAKLDEIAKKQEGIFF